MYRIEAAIFLSLFPALLSVNLAQADIWRCHQTGGLDLFTDNLKNTATCETYLPQSELGYMSRSSDATPTTVTASQPIPIEELPSPPETRREGTVPYNPIADGEEPFDYLYPYPGDYWTPFFIFTPRHHHHHQHNGLSSHHKVAHSSGHGGGLGRHR